MSQNRPSANNDPCISDFMCLTNNNPWISDKTETENIVEKILVIDKKTSIKGERGGNLKCLRVEWCETFHPQPCILIKTQQNPTN